MNDFLKMDIFFAVATVGFVIWIILMAIIMVYMIKITRTLNRIAELVEEETISIKSDIDAAREQVSDGVSGLLRMLVQTLKTGKRLLGKKKRRSS